MTHAPLRTSASSCALSALCALSGYAGEIVPKTSPSPERSLGKAPVSLAQEMGEAVPLDPAAVVVGEDTFAALLARRGEAAPLPARQGAAVLAANLADPAALGVIATLQHGPTRISSNLFIVLRDPALSPDGEIEGCNALVAAVELSGPVPWFGQSSRLALLSGRSGGGRRDVPRGCRPIFATRLRGGATREAGEVDLKR